MASSNPTKKLEEFLAYTYTARRADLGLPLATLNFKDFRDFAEYEGLVLISR